MTQSKDLLQKLYDFYKGRYTGQALEDKFNTAVADLVETNDIERGTYVTFCIDNDIEPKTKKETPLKHITPRSSYSSDSCGSGSSSYSSDSCGSGSRSTPTPSRSSYSSDSCGSGSSSYGRSSC